MIWALVIFLFLLSSLLLFPIGVELDYSQKGRRWYGIWMWLHIPLPDLVKRAKPPKETKGEVAEERQTRPLTERVRDFIESLRGGVEMVESGLQALRSLTRHLKIRVRRLHVIIATPDPALTGFSYGMACAVGGALTPTWPLAVAVDFTRTKPEVSFRVEARITLIKMAPAVWRFWRTLRKARAQGTKERKS